VAGVRPVLRDTPGLTLLMLFGSRARGDESPHSDWDFGYLGTPELDVDALLGNIVTAVASDRVDLVDLHRASGLLRFRVARDGVPVFEASAGSADGFRLEAAQFWCDAEAVLRRGYEGVLSELSA